MIYKRVAARLRAQDWVAIMIEICIVVIGVFIGTQVSNWNQDRAERRDAAQIVRQLRPALKTIVIALDGARTYLRKTDHYATIALAGWRGNRSVSDDQFVIAAYQASQSTTLALNTINWSAIYGGNQLSKLSDEGLRQSIATVMSLDLGQIDIDTANSPYRQHVRQVIPDDIQDAIRAKCGDIFDRARPFMLDLPASCHFDLPQAKWTAAANNLRARPDLVAELRWSRTAVASSLGSVGFFEPFYFDALHRLGTSQ